MYSRHGANPNDVAAWSLERKDGLSSGQTSSDPSRTAVQTSLSAARLSRQVIYYLLGGAVLLSNPEAANTTTIATQVEKQRIILVADSRESRANPQGLLPQAYRDDGCKLVALGKIGVGFTGTLDYQRTDPSDGVANWSAAADARAVHDLYGNDVHAMATEWAKRAAHHYAIFYRFVPERVRQLANVNSERVLVDALFAGWEGDIPRLVWEKIVLDESSGTKIRIREQIPPPSPIPSATNATTQELIDGQSSRAVIARAGWNSIAASVSTRETDWRHLAFLVKETGAFDKSVSEPVNVLQIPVGRQAAWIQNVTCRAR